MDAAQCVRNRAAAGFRPDWFRADCESAVMETASIPLRITASFGVAELASGSGCIEAADAFLRRADAALYEAKRSGRNCVRTQNSGTRSATSGLAL